MAQVISFHYTLKNSKGDTLESSYKAEPVAYMEGSGEIIPGLDRALMTLKPGEKSQVQVKSEEAYGDHDGTLVMDVPKAQLPTQKQINVGDQFSSQSPDGGMQVFTVKGVTDTHVTLDGNHPLAGQDLTFDVEVIEKREATEEELEHGHVHGAGGHHH